MGSPCLLSLGTRLYLLPAWRSLGVAAMHSFASVMSSSPRLDKTEFGAPLYMHIIDAKT